jgi:dTDP-4-amino-4,6-dideoxygalactose transaminase
MSFEKVKQFEEAVAKFFGSPYAVAVDCCTHGLELSLRYNNVKKMTVPTRTYLSVPMLSNKLNIKMEWSRKKWLEYYYLTDNIIDAAVLWRKNSYISGTLMCVSFQFKKHLSLGRGGVILLDDLNSKKDLKKMSYDGRSPDKSWTQQNIQTIGYHYYMTPETADLGLKKLPDAIKKKPRMWKYTDWPDLTEMDFFKNKEGE